MPITIGSNISSLLAQRQLGRASSELAQVNLRLASGSRINSAADDAAGLSISSSLNVDTRVFTQGVRNLNDGLSLLTVADLALEQLASVVTRQRELATQASNGSYGISQRKALDAEAQALSREYFRIARTTSFNSMKLFDGTEGQVVFQAGYGTQGAVSSSLGGRMGDGTFSAQVCYSTGGAPDGTYQADLNRDGNLDIVTVNGANTISVLVGNGNGSFKAKVDYPTGALVWYGDIGDFNNDNIVDFVVRNAGDNVSVFIGNGDGTFRARRSYGDAGGGDKLTIGDLNGDAFNDIVTANDDGVLKVYLGNGDGSFLAQVSYVSQAGNYPVQLGDLNNDGVLDAVTVGNGQVAVLIGNGNGSFKARSNYSSSMTGQGDNALADFNQDGFLDVVTTTNGSGQIGVLLGTGTGALAAERLYVATGGGMNDLATGDINGDGAPDLLAVSHTSDQLGILTGNGDGSFNAPVTYLIGDMPYGLTIADFDGDGVLDVATGNEGSNSVSILLGRARTGIPAQKTFSLSSRSEALSAISQFSDNLDRLAQQRSTIGAFQSRLLSAAATLLTMKENYAAAESRIKDADIAHESSQAIRQNILQQVATAVLSQANMQPTIALQLLRGD